MKTKENEVKSKTSQELRMLSPGTMNVQIVVLNCQKCKQCLNGIKFLGLLFVINSLSLSFLLVRSGHVFDIVKSTEWKFRKDEKYKVRVQNS